MTNIPYYPTYRSKPVPVKKDAFLKHIRTLLAEAREMLGEIHQENQSQVLWTW